MNEVKLVIGETYRRAVGICDHNASSAGVTKYTSQHDLIACCSVAVKHVSRMTHERLGKYHD